MLNSPVPISSSGFALIGGAIGLGSIAVFAGGASSVLWLAFGFVYLVSMLYEVLRMILLQA